MTGPQSNKGIPMELPKRKPTRLAGFDYATYNYYFITICTHQKKCIFGKPGSLSDLGKIAYGHMRQIKEHFSGVQVDNFIIMPNHVHAIVIIGEKTQTPNLSTVIGQYKASVAKEIHKLYPQMEIWQRSFHDHIIRNQKEYEKIWEYVQFNFQKWEEDCFYTEIYEK